MRRTVAELGDNRTNPLIILQNQNVNENSSRSGVRVILGDGKKHIFPPAEADTNSSRQTNEATCGQPVSPTDIESNIAPNIAE
jgi:hypothetical protein